MGTRSRIGVMHGDVVKSVYCHWDGYLDNNGRILQEHFDSVKANNLVALGDLSSLKPEIGTEHAFGYHGTDISAEEYEEKYGNMCTFYGRDRGEEGCNYQVAQTFEQFLDQVHGTGGEYYYIMKDGVWYAGAIYATAGLIKEGLVRLDEALAALPVEEECA
jgi:hypothetical protein